MKKGAAITAAAYCIWGVLPLYWKLLDHVDPIYILASRMVWSLVFCAGILAACKKTKAFFALVKDRRRFWLTALAGVFITINWGTYIWAVNSGHILDSSLGYYINPLMVILLGRICFKESLTRLEIVSVCLAAAGVLIMLVQLGEFPIVAIVLSVSFAIYGALKKQAGLDSEVSLAWETAVIAPFALFYIIFAETGGTGAVGVLSGAEFLLLPLAGVVTALPLLLYGYGVKSLPYSLVGILQYLSPTLSLILGVAVYHEAFTPVHFVTFVFIWAAVILFIASKLKQAKQLAVKA